ncbi:MAG TPA: nitronate monooxygenase, partial [Candidatus Kapabacteria bacterium]|nr:nitronate monooxygenase [Candidatus Kapabacteria bacterium]
HYRDPSGPRSTKPKTVPMFTYRPSRDLLHLTVLANYCEVWLAKEGHEGAIGINLLEKVQLPNLASLYGAMLAGVDVVLMGAGIPREIPMVLDRFAQQQTARIRLAVEGATSTDDYYAEFDPRSVMNTELPEIKRPKFYAIVSSEVLAKALLARSTGAIDGFVVEGHIAGGHNAPPRGGIKLDESGQPIYGQRDMANLSAFAELGVPFWIAGGQSGPDKLSQAIAVGAEGVQVGTDFAFCEESGFEPSLREQVLRQVYQGSAVVHTDPLASPTGFPFKVVQLEGTMSDPLEYAERPRLCQLGFLRRLYKREDGTVGYRCPGEPEEDFLRKGGKAEEMEGKKCLCNALIANIGMPQTHKDGYREKPLVTAGDSLGELHHYLTPERMHYTAKDVIEYILGEFASDQHTTSDACHTDC